MKTRQVVLEGADSAVTSLHRFVERDPAFQPDLLLVFGSVKHFSDPAFAGALRDAFPATVIAGCSTAGEILGDRVYDNSACITAVKFDSTRAIAESTELTAMTDSHDAGARLARQLPAEGLAAVLVFGTGVAINGSALVAGLQSVLPASVKIAGGLAGDGGAFVRTWTIGPAGSRDDHVVVVGLYGESLQFDCGSYGGWAPFGPARKVTRSDHNVLYELDGERALDVYKRYLGDYAQQLPGAGLLFPFEMLCSERDPLGVYRTVLAVDEASGSLTLAGDIDPNGYLKLMHSSTDKLIDGAENAARIAMGSTADEQDVLAILVSCVGRKIIMGDRVEEEVEAVAELCAAGTAITGFYSNGEISSTAEHGGCRLHNQTMTISWIREA